MPWPKGKPRPNNNPLPPGGSRKGQPNKITREIKEMVVGALTAEGGQAYLQRAANESMPAFLALVGKVLPLQVTGEGGGALVIRWEQGASEGSGDA